MSITDELREWVTDHYSGWKSKQAEGIAIADRIDAAVDGMIELPKDADGEYINVGDRLDGYGKTIEVMELRYGRSGWVIISRDGNGYADTFAFTHHKPTAIADRIDAEHERQMAERRRSCVFYDAERNYCKVHDEGDMAELGYVRLPVDTDGVPIRIGDVMEWVPYDDTYQTVVRKVVAVGADVFFAWSDEKHGYAQYEACAYRHHHAPTVEDVLREFAEKMNENLGMYTGEAIDADEWRSADAKTIAEYAKRLTLAEGEDA